jgi:hypothetical protein
MPGLDTPAAHTRVSPRSPARPGRRGRRSAHPGSGAPHPLVPDNGQRGCLKRSSIGRWLEGKRAAACADEATDRRMRTVDSDHHLATKALLLLSGQRALLGRAVETVPRAPEEHTSRPAGVVQHPNSTPAAEARYHMPPITRVGGRPLGHCPTAHICVTIG